MHNVDRGMISRFSCFVSLVLLIALNAILGGVLVVLTEVYNSSYPFALVMIYNVHGLAMGLFYLIFALEWRTLWQTEPHAYVQVTHELGKTFESSEAPHSRQRGLFPALTRQDKHSFRGRFSLRATASSSKQSVHTGIS